MVIQEYHQYSREKLHEVSIIFLLYTRFLIRYGSFIIIIIIFL